MKSIFNTKDITEPKSGLIVYKDAWWMCENGDPTKALFYGMSPQCNKNKLICEWVIKNKLYEGENIEIIFVETAFVPPQPD